MLFCPTCFAPVPSGGKFCNFCGAKIEPKERADAWLNQRFAEHYLITKKLGTGSYGDVYLAEHLQTKQPFAIKILRKTLLQSPQTISRFQREGIAANRLEHPAALRIFECAQAESGEPYLIMEFVEGQSLKQCLEKRTLDLQEFFSIMLPLCEVLAEAHQKGIIHRDIKPDNIMLTTQQGVFFPKLLDFGLANILGESKLTLTGTVIGTPPYMAPEQWGGLKFAEARSDLYALGVVAYRCLSGRFPFEAKNPAEWLKMHKFEDPIDLRLSARWVPQNLSTIIMRLLEKLPSKRYETPLELRDALNRVQHSLEPTVIGEALEETSFREPLPKEPTEETPTQQLHVEVPGSGEFGSTIRVLHEEPGEAAASGFELSFLAQGRALLRVLATADKRLLIAGSHGLLYQSSDLGLSWERLEYQSGAALYSLWSDAAGEQLICGEGGLLLRRRAGEFHALHSQTSHSLYAIWGGNRGLYIAGEHGTLLRKSGDVVFVLRLGQATLFSGCQSAFGDLFAVGKKGTIFRSTDYGFTWHPKQSNTENDLHAITTTKSGELIAVGKSGTILRSMDRGQTWSQDQSLCFDDLYDIEAAASGALYIVGSQGTILLRPAGAAQWSKLVSPTSNDLFSASSLPDDRLVIVGDAGAVLFSARPV